MPNDYFMHIWREKTVLIEICITENMGLWIITSGVRNKSCRNQCGFEWWSAEKEVCDQGLFRFETTARQANYLFRARRRVTSRQVRAETGATLSRITSLGIYSVSLFLFVVFMVNNLNGLINMVLWYLLG